MRVKKDVIHEVGEKCLLSVLSSIIQLVWKECTYVLMVLDNKILNYL